MRLGAIAAAALLAAVHTACAADAVKIDVVLPLTGNASFVGQEQQQMLQLVEKHTNATGGIQGRPLHFAFSDDQTSPQIAVQLANRIIAEHPGVMLGSSITAMCNAMAPLMRNGPVMYCLSPGIHPAPSGYVFSTFVQTQQLEQALIRHFRVQNWRRIAMLSSTDATGQDADQGMDAALKLPENAGLQMVEHPHFNATDISVTAQIERIKQTNAQALVAWTTGAQIATIFKGLVQVGLDIPVATTPGNQQFEQLAQYTNFLPKPLLIPSSLYPPHEGVIKLDPRLEQVQHQMYDLLGAANLRADNATGTAWDPALIVVEALRHLGADAKPEQIRDYIADLTAFPGINGFYDFKRVPQRGLDVDSAVIVRYDGKDQRWTWVSAPGGGPLAP